MKLQFFDHLKLTSYISYYNSLPFAIFLFSVVWKMNPTVVTSRFHITFAPIPPTHISHFVEIQVRTPQWYMNHRKFYFYLAYFHFNLLCKKYPGIISIFILRN